MPYVPGSEVDVFISYSWADNRNGWVTCFEKALKDRLHELLGAEPKVWRDERELSGEHDFTEEIKLRLTHTAVLVLMVSNSYLASDFCRLERLHFSAHVSGGLRIGTRLKIVKAIKLPADNNLHRSIVKDAFGFTFFKDQAIQGPVEYFPGDRDFALEIDRLAKGLSNLLRAMYNEKMPVYVAEPAPAEAVPAWKRLRAELESRGFRVLPTFRPDPDCDPEILLSAMKPAVSSVHLLGAAFSEFAALQLEFARQLETSTVVWLPPEARPEARQGQFLETLSGFRRLTVLRTEPYWNLAKIVADQIRPEPPAPAAPARGNARIYLICDRKNPADSEAASRLSAEIAQQEKMEVFLPDVDRDAAILDEQQQKRLADCDGVLLYWGHARKEWFYENYGDLVRAERRLRARSPFRSSAIVLDLPDDADKGQAPGELVLRLRPPVLESIEPFLKPLRALGRAQAGD